MSVGKAIGQRIKQLCEEKEMSINGLAVASGVAQSTVNNIMDGSSKNPTVHTVYKLCKGFGIELSDFFTAEIFENMNTK